MKEMDKNDLKKVSGSKDWRIPFGGSNGITYILDEEAYKILKKNGYKAKVNEECNSSLLILTSINKMMALDVTDATGQGIGDAAMQNLLGAPTPW